MAYEGTGKYFLLLFLILFIVYVTAKISLAYIFKSAKISSWKAFIPFYNRLLLTDKLDLKRSVFYKTLIPVVNLYYYYIIICKLLEAYNMDSKEAIYFLLIPMYKFPELVFKKPQFMLHLYDNTKEFLNNEKSLFEKESSTETINPNSIHEAHDNINPNNYQAKTNPQPINQNETVTSNDTHKQETIIGKTQNSEALKVCPNCGTKLDPAAKICFFCGNQISWQYN